MLREGFKASHVHERSLWRIDWTHNSPNPNHMKFARHYAILACLFFPVLGLGQSLFLAADGNQNVSIYFNSNLVFSESLTLTDGAEIDLSLYGQGTYIVDFDGTGSFHLDAAGFDCDGGCTANAFIPGLHTFSLFEPLTCAADEQRLRMAYDGLNALQAGENADEFAVLVSESNGGSALLEHSGAGAWQSCVSDALCYDITATNNEPDLESILFTGRFTVKLDEVTHFILAGNWDWDTGTNSLTRTIGNCNAPTCAADEQLLTVVQPQGAGYPGATGVYKRVELIEGNLQQSDPATGSFWWEPFAASIESTQVLAEGNGTLNVCISSNACHSLGMVGSENGYWQPGSVNYGTATALLDNEPVKVYESNWGDSGYLPVGDCSPNCAPGQTEWSIAIDGAQHITGEVLGGIDSDAEISMSIGGPGEWFGCMDDDACYYIGFEFDLDATAAGNPQNLQPGAVEVVVAGQTVIDVAGNAAATAEWTSGDCSANPFGCTNPASSNYDPAAEINDGSCLTTFDATCDSTGNVCYGNNWSEEEVLVVGTTAPGGAFFGLKGAMDDDFGNNFDNIFLYDGVDPATSNLIASGNNFESGTVFYTPTGVIRATITSSPSGSCESTTNPFYPEHFGLDWAFSCSPIVYGCTDPTAGNFDLSATHPLEGACTYDGCNDAGSWCDDRGYEEFEYVAPEGHWLFAAPVGAYEYDAFTQSLGWMNEAGEYLGEVSEAIFSSEGYLRLEIYASDLADCSAPIEWTVQCIAEEDIVAGCDDPSAANYNPDANIPGMCLYEGCGSTGTFCHRATENYVAEVQTIVSTGDGTPGQLNLVPGDMYFTDFVIYDGADPATSNVVFSYEQNPVIEYPEMIDLFSATGTFAFEVMNVQSGGGVGTASCEAGDALPWDWALVCGETTGCTDPLYSEFDPLADLNDGSCATCPTGSVIEIVYDRADWPTEDLEWTLTRGDGSVVASAFVSEAAGEGVEPEAWTIPICEAVATCYTLTFEEFGFFPDGFDGAFSGTDGTATVFVNGQQAAVITGNWGNITSEVILCTGGCTDPTAVNYDESAVADNGSCIGEASCEDAGTFCTGVNENGTQIQAALAVPSGEPGYLALEGLLHSGQDFIRVYSESTLSSSALLYEATWLFAESVYSPTGEFYITFVSNDERSCATGNLDPVHWQLSCEAPVFGCTDADAVNFDPEATMDDGTCAQDACGESGQICPPNNLYPASVLQFAHPDGLPIQVTLNGSMGNDFLLVSDQYNVMDIFFEGAPGNLLATLGVGGQSQTVNNLQLTSSTGVMDLGISTGSTLACADGDYEGIAWTVQCLNTGCTDNTACNFEPAATQDDGSCVFDVDACGVCGGDGSTCTGCTDATACNYDSEAVTDDGSCAYTSFALTYSTDAAPATNTWALVDDSGEVVASGAPNAEDAFTTVTTEACVNDGCYAFQVTDALGNGIAGGSWSWADADGEVISSGAWNEPFAIFEEAICFGLLGGCTDSMACNFDETAVVDDGSCAYATLLVSVDLDSYASEISWDVTDGNGSVLVSGGGYGFSDASSTVTGEACASAGCYTFNLYDSYGDGMSGNSWSVSDASGALLSGTFDNGNETGGEFCLEQAVLGCTDEVACNYDASANVDDGSCAFGTLLVSVDLDSYPGEISWDVMDSEGSVLVAGGGYGFSDAFSTVTGEACAPAGCYTFNLYDSYGDGMSGNSWSVSDASGTLLSGTFDNGNDTGGEFCVEEAVPGCTDEVACNYDASANFDDGSCNFAGISLTLHLDAYPEETSWTLTDDETGAVVLDGDGYGTAFEVVEIPACLAYGCYTFELADSYGDGMSGDGWSVMDAEGSVLAEGTFSNGSSTTGGFCLIEQVSGCMDAEACNYNPDANLDDGSCAFVTLDLAFTLDSYPEETSWNLQDDAGNIIESGSGYADSYGSVEASVCVAYGCYVFNLLDSYGDGISSNSWSVSSAGSTLASGDFPTGDSVSGEFCVVDGGGCTHPMACNYDVEATEDDGSCIFFESDVVTADEEFMIGALGFYAQFEGEFESFTYECEAGIDPYGDFPLNFVVEGPVDAPLSAMVTPATFDLIDTYVETAWLPVELVPLMQGALFSGQWTVCGETMSVAIPGFPVFSGSFNGTAFVFPQLGVYVAPASEVDEVCSDLSACNFALCGLHNPELCVYPEIGQDCDGNCLSDSNGDGACDEVTSASCGDAEAVNFDPELGVDFDGGCIYGSCYEEDELCVFFPDLGAFIVHASPNGEPAYLRINSGTIDHGYAVYDGLSPNTANVIASETTSSSVSFNGELFVSQTGIISVWAVDPLNLQSYPCELGDHQPLAWQAGCVGVGPEYCGDGMIWDPVSGTCQAEETCLGDFNDDGVVSASDLLDFLGVFGTTCENGLE